MSWWREHTFWRRTVKTLIALIIVLLLLIGSIVAVLASPWFRAHLGEWVSKETGRKISFGPIDIHWAREPVFVFHQVKIANTPWGKAPYLFSADRVEFTIRPWQLLRGRLVLPELQFDRPDLALEKNAKGENNWNFSSTPQALAVREAAPQKRTQMPVIGHLNIESGKLGYSDEAKHIDTTLNVSTATGTSGAERPIILDGKGTYRAQPFMIYLKGASVLELRESSEPYPFLLKTRIGPTEAEADGTVKDPFKMEALNIHLRLSGKSASDLYPITGIALPPSPPYHISGHLDSDGKVWRFTDFKGRVGNSDLRGNLSWRAEEKPPYLKADFISENLDMKDLAGFIGAEKKPADESRVIPDEEIDVARLKSMNADVSFRGEHVKTPQLLDDFLMNVHLKDGVLKVTPVSFGIGTGRISADVDIDARQTPPPVTLDATFHRLSLARLFAPLVKDFGKKNVSAGYVGGKAKLFGTGKSLRAMLGDANGEIGIGMEGGKLSDLLLRLIGLDIFRAAGLILTGDKPIAIRCVVGDFGVEDGIVKPKEFLIDTDVIAIDGRGQINLKNEHLNMRLITHPKQPSLFSAHSPILITGTLKQPHVGVDPAALAERGGLAVALGALLTPVGSLLAFLQPGLGNNSDCVNYINTLEQKTEGNIPKNAPASIPSR